MTFSKYPYPFVSIFFSVCKCSSEKTQQFKDHTTSSVIKAFWCYSLSQSFFPSLLLGIVITSNRCQPFQCCCTSHVSIFLSWGLLFFLLTPMPVIWSQLFQQKNLRSAVIMDGRVSPAPAIHCLHPSPVYSLVTVLYVLIIRGA